MKVNGSGKMVRKRRLLQGCVKKLKGLVQIASYKYSHGDGKYSVENIVSGDVTIVWYQMGTRLIRETTSYKYQITVLYI